MGHLSSLLLVICAFVALPTVFGAHNDDNAMGKRANSSGMHVHGLAASAAAAAAVAAGGGAKLLPSSSLPYKAPPMPPSASEAGLTMKLHRHIRKPVFTTVTTPTTTITAATTITTTTTTTTTGIPLSQPRPLNVQQQRRLRRRGTPRNMSVLPMEGRPTVAFSVAIDFGTPGQTVECILDTGSSNLAVAGAPSDDVTAFYDSSRSTTSRRENRPDFGVDYVVGQWKAHRVADQVQLHGAPDTAVRAEFGSIYSSKSFFRAADDSNGILGLAYRGLAQPTNYPVKPLLDQVWASQPDLAHVFSMQMCVFDSPYFSDYGNFSLGGILDKQAVGDFQWTNITQAEYYGVEVRGIKFNGEMLPVSCDKYNNPGWSIVDSGTTVLSLPYEAHGNLTEQLNLPVDPSVRDIFYQGGACVMFPRRLIATFPTFYVTLAASEPGKQFDLPVSPFHYLRGVTTESGDECFYFSVAGSCGPSGSVLGIALMSGYVTAFDRFNARIGFATSTCTAPPLKPLEPAYAIPSADSAFSCGPNPDFVCPNAPPAATEGLGWWIWASVAAGVIVLVLLVIIARMYWKQRRRRHRFIVLTQADPDEEAPGLDAGAVQVTVPSPHTLGTDA